MRMIAALVFVVMEMEDASPPADEQPHGQRDHHEADEHLRALENGGGKVRPIEDDRQAEGKERGRVPQAPREAETAGEPRRALLLRADERGYRGEMVGIGCVTQAEHDGDGDNDRERRPVRRARDLLVEPEHHAIPGRARAVIVRPRPMMTSALAAGSRRRRRLSKLRRLKVRLAVTARRPIAVIAAARPTLNARMRTSP